MKINRLVSAIFFFVVGLFSLASLQAQEAKTLFVNIPDSLTPLLTKVNREDCIDFLESKMKAQVENRFGKKSEMTELGTDYVRMQMSPQTSWQMKVLALSDTAEIFENHAPWIRPCKVVVEFGVPIDPKTLSKEEKKHLGAYCRERIQKMLDKNKSLIES